MRSHTTHPSPSPATSRGQGQPVRTDALQRRTLTTLFLSQVCGGMGLVSGYVATALLADDITQSKTLAGLSAACLSIGATMTSFPLASLMARSGRRPGLRLGYLLGAAGASLAVLAAITRVFIFLPIGVLGIGAGNAANLAARYAAADLSRPERRTQDIGILVAATTVGSGTGSLLSLSVFDPLGTRIGLPNYGGSFLVGALLFLAGAAVIELWLRPDPLRVAGGVGEKGSSNGRLPITKAMELILANPPARLAVLAMMISQATMVGTMTLTPLHMKDGDQSGLAISVMLFLHIMGMYLFSPLIGRLADRFGRYPMLGLSGAMCSVGALWAGTTPSDEFTGLAGGQTLIGLAWCFGVLSASGLLTESFPVAQRASVQGAGDLCMTLFGAIAGVTAGAIVAYRSYLDLNLGAALLGAALFAAVVATATTSRRGSPMAEPSG